MKTIPSFTIDHIRLLRGIYVSRKDEMGSETVTTFDIRMKEPNREPALGQGALHTIEHLAATYLRNHPIWSDKIVYWGPMGCLTGNYLLMKGDLKSEDIVELMRVSLYDNGELKKVVVVMKCDSFLQSKSNIEKIMLLSSSIEDRKNKEKNKTKSENEQNNKNKRRNRRKTG